MNEIHLFAGAGGGVLGSLLMGHRPIAYIEINEYCQQVLRQRMDDGIFPVAPIFTDVRQFLDSGFCDEYRGFTQMVAAGFPCQPFSLAGKQLGGKRDQFGNPVDERDLWPETLEVSCRVGAEWLLGENVYGLLSSDDDVCGTYFGRILRDLAAEGYDVEWTCMGANDPTVGAPHQRKRVWLLAHKADMANPNQQGSQGRDSTILRQRSSEWSFGQSRPWWEIDPADLGDSDCASWLQAGSTGEEISLQGTGERTGRSGSDDGEGEPQPQLGRVAHGVSNRIQRLKALGNAQVPAVAAAAWSELFNRYKSRGVVNV